MLLRGYCGVSSIWWGLGLFFFYVCVGCYFFLEFLWFDRKICCCCVILISGV